MDTSLTDVFKRTIKPSRFLHCCLACHSQPPAVSRAVQKKVQRQIRVQANQQHIRLALNYISSNNRDLGSRSFRESQGV